MHAMPEATRPPARGDHAATTEGTRNAGVRHLCSQSTGVEV
jgi:hypothetical protein